VVTVVPSTSGRRSRDLVEEDDAALLGALHRVPFDLRAVDEAVDLLPLEHSPRLRDRHLAARGPREHPPQGIAQVHLQRLHPLAAEQVEHRRAGLGDLHLDLALLELPLAQHLAQGPAGLLAAAVGCGGEEEVEEAVLGAALGGDPDPLGALLADHGDRRLDEVADDGVHVAADIADLGELRGLHLDERRSGEAREAARDLRLAHAGGPDEDDVGGVDLAPQLLGELLPAPAVTQGDGHGPLGVALPDDVAVELGDDLAGRELRGAHGTTSTLMWSLV
jgi:hypothetical protein